MKLPLVYCGFHVNYTFDGTLYEGEIKGLDIFIQAYNLEQLEINFKEKIER